MTFLNEINPPLEHHGIRGMKWGVRRDNSGGTSSKTAKPAKLTRKQVSAEKHSFYQAKADRILKTAMSDTPSLIALRTHNDAVIVTGEEFIHHMSRGGVMNIKATDVWATQPKKDSPYVLNPNINQPFVRSDKRKP